jgi:hypothetical protein
LTVLALVPIPAKDRHDPFFFFHRDEHFGHDWQWARAVIVIFEGIEVAA